MTYGKAFPRGLLARLLGLTRDMLRYRIEKLGLARLKHDN